MSNEQNRICEVALTVPFHDLDPLQMVWHGHYLKYFDVARSALFVQGGVDLFEYFKATNHLFPVTKTSTRHIMPLRYLDIFKSIARVVEAQYKIVIDFEIRLVENDQICARGRSEQVAVRHPDMEILFEIPGYIRAALGF